MVAAKENGGAVGGRARGSRRIRRISAADGPTDLLSVDRARRKGDASYELAVTPQQVIELGLTTQTANPADAREFDGVNGDGVSTCQAEAIPPDQLAEIVRSAVLAEIDREAMARTRVRQQVDIAVLRAMVPELWAEES